jgi:DNA-binding LytR/AlgR family response regulator
MSYKVLIVDDEPLARRVLAEYLIGQPDFTLCAEKQTAETAFSWLNQHPVDLLFLDINLPGISGLELLRDLKISSLVIFTTAYPEFAVEAFEVEAFDYLLKPISKDRFLASLTKVKKHLSASLSEQQSIRWINLKEGRRTYRVNKNDLLYLQAYGDYVRVYTQEKTYMIKERLQNFARQLPNEFIQVHRSYIINLDAIDFLEGNMVSIRNEAIPVSDSYKEALNKAILPR